MPKLNLDKSFVNKLNSINRGKSKSNLKPEVKTKSKFKISDDTTPFFSNNPLIKKKSEKNPPIVESYQDYTNKIFPKLVLENMSEIGIMWESFDDSIKKIVLSEIIEKYYLYKRWKFNSVSFISGFLFAVLMFFTLKIIM